MYRPLSIKKSYEDIDDGNFQSETVSEVFPVQPFRSKRARRDSGPPEPKLRLIADDEDIDVEPLRAECLKIQDQISRLRQTLEHERREKAELQKKYDNLRKAQYLQEQAQSAWKAVNMEASFSPFVPSMPYSSNSQTSILQGSSIPNQPAARDVSIGIPFYPQPYPRLSPLSTSNTTAPPLPAGQSAPPVESPEANVTPKKPSKTLLDYLTRTSRQLTPQSPAPTTPPGIYQSTRMDPSVTGNTLGEVKSVQGDEDAVDYDDEAFEI